MHTEVTFPEPPPTIDPRMYGKHEVHRIAVIGVIGDYVMPSYEIFAGDGWHAAYKNGSLFVATGLPDLGPEGGGRPDREILEDGLATVLRRAADDYVETARSL